MPLFGSKKVESPIEPGPNPFRPPMILNTHIKFDERKQTLEVLVRNLQNSPLGEKVKIVGKFVEKNASEKRKKKCLVSRMVHRSKPDNNVAFIQTDSTPAKAGPNPHYNATFNFVNLIKSDVLCGKLIFEIYETSLTKSRLLGSVEMEGCDIKLDRDTAYSLYVRDPRYTPLAHAASMPAIPVIADEPQQPRVDVVDCVQRAGMSTHGSVEHIVCVPTDNVVCEIDKNNEVECHREYECFQENASNCSSSQDSVDDKDNCSQVLAYEVLDGRMQDDDSSSSDSYETSSISSCDSSDSEITIYEVIQVDPRRVSKHSDEKVPANMQEFECSKLKTPVVVKEPAQQSAKHEVESGKPKTPVVVKEPVRQAAMQEVESCKPKTPVVAKEPVRQAAMQEAECCKPKTPVVAKEPVRQAAMQEAECCKPKAPVVVKEPVRQAAMQEVECCKPKTPIMVKEPVQQATMSNVCCSTEIVQNHARIIGDQDSTIDENAVLLHSNIQYNDRHQRLTVFIRNLGIVDEKLPHSVKVVLYTADGRRLERKTSHKYGKNPYFNQEVEFNKLVPGDIRGGHLLFTVNEIKRFGKNVIGMGIIPGSRINLIRDEAYNTAIVQQYSSKIPKKFTYNPNDVTNEPDNLLRVVYPESQRHFEIYK